MQTDSLRLLACALIAAAAPAVAQCSVIALTNAFPANAVYASVPWDPDGTGPLGVQIAFVGANAGSTISVFDPLTSQVSLLPPLGFPVYALAALPNGELVAGGFSFFMTVQSRPELARWNGTAWTVMVSQTTHNDPGVITALAALPNGDLIVGGSFSRIAGLYASNVARWDGSAWHTLGPSFWVATIGSYPGGVIGNVFSLLVEPDGDLIVGGIFAWAGGVFARSVARWDGAMWHALGSGVNTGVNNGVYTIARQPNGDLVVGGTFTQAGPIPAPFVARWDGTAWHAMGQLTGEVMRLLVLPNGDLAVRGGGFALPAGPCLGRWNGSTWSTLGPGVPNDIASIAALPSGDVLVTPHSSSPLLTLRTTCPAATASFGAGCAGTGGMNELRADTLPWTGSTFRCTATGMPGSALVLSVYGFTQLAMPMSSVLPQGLPGCTIHMTPDAADVLLPAAGTVQTSLPLPNQPALAGIVLHHYVVPFEVDPAFNIVAVTSSNALTMTVGSW